MKKKETRKKQKNGGRKREEVRGSRRKKQTKHIVGNGCFRKKREAVFPLTSGGATQGEGGRRNEGGLRHKRGTKEKNWDRVERNKIGVRIETSSLRTFI